MSQPQLVHAQQIPIEMSTQSDIVLPSGRVHYDSFSHNMAAATSSKSIREQRPDLFEFTFIDRHDGKRTVPMEVLSLGFSRTGTASMQLALEILGYPTYHTTRILSNPPDADMWMEAINTKYLKQGSTRLDRQFWDGLLGNYGATTDIPAGSFHEELRAAYPDVKCILVERDVEAWYKSWHDVQIKQYGNLLFKVVATIDPKFIGRIWTFSATGVLEGICGAKSKQDLEEKSRRIYLEHNERVKATVPASKLLLYKLGDGWEPICKFLGKSVPDVPFPKVNETEMVNEYVGIVIKMGLVNTLQRWALVATPVVAVVAAYWW